MTISTAQRSVWKRPVLYLTIVSIYILVPAGLSVYLLIERLPFGSITFTSGYAAAAFGVAINVIAAFALWERYRIGVYLAAVLLTQQAVLYSFATQGQYTSLAYPQISFFLFAPVAMMPLLYLGWKKNQLR